MLAIVLYGNLYLFFLKVISNYIHFDTTKKIRDVNDLTFNNILTYTEINNNC